MKRKDFIKTTGLGISAACLAPFAATSANQIKTTNPLLKPKVVRKQEGQVHNVIGDIQTHKLVGKDTGNQLVEWTNHVPPGVSIPPHIHTREDEIFRVTQGEVAFNIAGEEIILRAGDTAFAPKNIPHAWTVIGNEKARMITSAFPAGIEFLFEELAALPQGEPDFEKVAQICQGYGISFVG